MPEEYAYFDVDFTWDGNFNVLELGSGLVAESPTYDRHEKMPMKAKFLKLLATKFDTIFILRSPSYMTLNKEFDFEKRANEYLSFLDENEKKKFKLALFTDKIVYDTTQKVVALFIDEGVFTEKNSVRYQNNYNKANFFLPVINGPSSCTVIARDKIVFSDFADIAKMPNKPCTQPMELHNWKNSVESILANTKSNFLVIKPTNEAGGEGILVVHRDKLNMTLACLANPNKKLPEKLDEIEKQKYQYWREKKGNYNGFCLIQDYKPSKAVQSYLVTGRLFFFVTKNEANEVTIEVIDGYWKFPRITAEAITTTSTVSYVYGENSPYKRIDEADFKIIVQQCQTTLAPVMNLVFSMNHNQILKNLLFNQNRLLVNYILKNNFEFLLPKDIHHAYNLFDLSIATQIFKHLPKEQEKQLWLKYLTKILLPSGFLKRLSFFDNTLAAIEDDIEAYNGVELKDIETLLITIFNTLNDSPTTKLANAEQIIALLKKLRGPALTLTMAKSYLNYAVSLDEQNENSQLVKENYLRAIAILSEISSPTPASNESLNNYQGYFADYLYLQGVKLMGVGKAQTLHIATEHSLQTIKQAKAFFQEGMAISKKLPDQINGRINSIKHYTMASLYSGFAYIADKNNLQEMCDNFHLALQEFEKIPNDGRRRKNHDQQHTIIKQNYEHLLKQLDMEKFSIEKNKTTKTTKKTTTPPKTSELKSGFFQKREKKKESNPLIDLADYKEQIFADPELEFRQAAAKGDLKKVKYLLEISPQKISNIDCVGQGTTAKLPSGKTALHFAAEKGKCNVVKYLLGHKANLTKEDSQKATPLELAYQNTNEAATEILNYLFMNDMGNFIGGVYIKIIECEGKQFEAKVKSSVTDKVLTPAELLEFGNLIDISTNHLNKLRALLNNSDYKDDIIKICETAFNGFLDKKFHGLAKTQAVTLPELISSISQLNSP